MSSRPKQGKANSSLSSSNDTLVQEQKRKFSPGDNVPFSDSSGGRRQQTDFREPAKDKSRTGWGIKPKSQG